MLMVEVESSDDPVLNVLQANPREIFGRTFAGYILFLFGAADEEVATWFSRALVALDSLTGEDIACVVFARRVKVRSELAKTVGRVGSKRTEEGVLLDTICRPVGRARGLVEDGVPSWSPNQREITAVTYAVDDIARELDVIDKLPCLVFLDAIPNGVVA